jgi:hypothetical protein
MRVWFSALIFIFLQFSHVAAAREMTMATLRLHRDDGIFLVKVFDTDTVAPGPRIRIECVEKCRHPVFFEDNTADPTMGIFALSGKEGIIFTLWGTGSALVVRVYKIGPVSVSRVFEGYTKWYPYFIGSSAPAFVIRTFLYDQRADIHKDQPKIYDWRWDGSSFSRIPVKPANLQPPSLR